MLDSSGIVDALSALGDVLQSRGYAFEVVSIGGSSLLLLGLSSRVTRDLDIVALVRDGQYVAAQPLPPELMEAARDVGDALGLGEHWLNAGPAQLLMFGLPDGFARRAERRAFGPLVLHVASRVDQVHFKLYATVDQGLRSKHAADLRQLAPTHAELVAAARWTRQHDPSEPFRELLLEVLVHFRISDVNDQV